MRRVEKKTEMIRKGPRIGPGKVRRRLKRELHHLPPASIVL